MKRCMLLVLVVLTVVPGPASAQQQAPSSGMGGGMMGEGMMSGMMGQSKDPMGGCAMTGGMMAPEMMGSMMPSMMDTMMPGISRGCMMMAEGMMKGQIDLGWMKKTLGLSEEQSERLRSTLRPFQKEVILAAASLKVAELELSDVVGRTPVDYGRVDAKLKEAEAIRTKIRLAHIRAGEAVKGILGKEQLEKLQGMSECRPPADQAPAAAPQKQGGGPATGSEHEQHH